MPMSRRFQADPFDLLGQKEIYPYAVHLPGKGEPGLSIAWNSFHQNFFSEFVTFFQWTRLPKGVPDANLFRDCRVTRQIPARAIIAAALWHVVFFIVPWPQLSAARKQASALDNAELTWSGPIDDLPLLKVPRERPKVAAKSSAMEKPDESTDAFHPRQRIYTDPVHPNHPRQTLVKPADPMEAPKFLTPLPNMVQLAASAGPARPKLEISEQALAKLRPKQAKRIATTDAPAPDVPNMEVHPAEMSLATAPSGPARPKLDINAGSAPRMGERTQKGEITAAPELAAENGNAGGGPVATMIALSATPAPPTPVVEVPKGNLAAHVAISPEGKGAGTGGGSGNSKGSGGGTETGGNGEGKNSIGISISGGNPKPNAGMSGLAGAGKLNLPRPQALYKRANPSETIDDPPARTGPPDFDSLPPGAPPEQIFASQHVYSMNVNMPNLNSATGSWIIHFSELRLAGTDRVPGEIAPPVPRRKVDPEYPPTAIQEHIEGEVILYGVIRPDGSVDSIQVVRGIDPQLDANAAAAFSQWKFHPASKGGHAVALEAIVHIPFRGPERQ
jgi:TonB family protein